MSIEEALHLGETYHWKPGHIVRWGIVNEDTGTAYKWITIFEAAFKSYSDICNLNFKFVGLFDTTGDADIDGVDTIVRFEALSPGIGGQALPGFDLYEHFNYNLKMDDGDITMSINYFHQPEYSGPGSNTYQLILHEIGHSAGLKHPHNEGMAYGTAKLFSDYLYLIGFDSTRYTVMSYANLATYNESKALGPRGLDILALQIIYGPPEHIPIIPTITGNEVGGNSYWCSSGTQVRFNQSFANLKVIRHTVFKDEFPDIEVIQVTKGLEKSNQTVWLIGHGESIRFDDYCIGISETSAQVYRLYQAAFNRAPDYEGLGYWIGRRNEGLSLNAIAQRFIVSAEFLTMYFGNDAQDFVTNLYQNALHRTPDQGGLDFWINEIKTGKRTRARVLVEFSESQENKDRTADAIKSGIKYV